MNYETVEDSKPIDSCYLKIAKVSLDLTVGGFWPRLGLCDRQTATVAKDLKPRHSLFWIVDPFGSRWFLRCKNASAAASSVPLLGPAEFAIANSLLTFVHL